MPDSPSTEVRAFRPILEWRAVLQGSGFADSMLYDVEEGDPTQDEMMCFYKPPFWHTNTLLTGGVTSPTAGVLQIVCVCVCVNIIVRLHVCLCVCLCMHVCGVGLLLLN